MLEDIIGYRTGRRQTALKGSRFAVFLGQVQSPWSRVWTANVIRLGSHCEDAAGSPSKAVQR
jgi:hypothetical protein